MEDRIRPQHRNRVGDLFAVEDIDPLPLRECRNLRRRLGSGPADEISGSGQQFNEVAASEPAGSGHEDDGVAHRLRLAEEAEEVGERPEAGQYK
jgi:hypothetical protein